MAIHPPFIPSPGKSDPYLVISRASNTGFTVVHKTEVVKHTLNPRWRPIELPIAKLCNGEADRPLRVRLRAACGCECAFVTARRAEQCLNAGPCVYLPPPPPITHALLQMEVFDWDKNSAPDFIGSCETTLKEMLPLSLA